MTLAPGSGMSVSSTMLPVIVRPACAYAPMLQVRHNKRHKNLIIETLIFIVFIIISKFSDLLLVMASVTASKSRAAKELYTKFNVQN
jgi:hypothetical protein